MKTTLANIVVEIKHAVDYDFSNADSDFTTLVVEKVNKNLKVISQLLYDHNIITEITNQSTFQSIESQSYRDIRKAVITGDVASFTGTANDKINVTIDGTAYADIDVSGDASIADVVSAINTSVGSTVASETTDGYLQITSLVTTSSSSVTIADGTTTGQTVIAELFSDSDYRTSTGTADLGDIIRVSERDNDTYLQEITYDMFRKMYVNPADNESSTPDVVSRFEDYIYLAPTPTNALLFYLDYYKVITEVTTGDTLPFTNKYDPLLVAMCKEDIRGFLRKDAAVEAQLNRQEIRELKQGLIIGASNNVGMAQGSVSRRGEIPYFAPRRQV